LSVDGCLWLREKRRRPRGKDVAGEGAICEVFLTTIEDAKEISEPFRKGLEKFADENEIHLDQIERRRKSDP
jgi:hypothetical protein